LDYRRRIQAQGQEFTPWGIDRVNVSSLWAIPPKRKVKICLIDTGYDRGHPDLPTTNVNGWVRNTTCGTKLTNGNWYDDEDGHGTFTSGIVGARGKNGEEDIVLSVNLIILFM
jgi:serine protease